MTSAPKISVAVVSFQRPDHLRRCLLGISQLFYRDFEVVVVADEASLDAISTLPFAARLKRATQAVPNISHARNQAVALARGEIVAFLDDDAVPEPTWLGHMASAFQDPETDAAAGHVLGRNGISYQWKSRAVRADGSERPLDLPDDAPTIPPLEPGEALKLEGTNFAVRRTVFATLGGFDPAFVYFLDDTDFALRLAATGTRVAAVPRALVHHGQAADSRRAGNRAPKSLFEIGASTAVFARKHNKAEPLESVQARVTRAQTQRLHRFLQDGFLEPRDIRPLLSGLAAGFEEGRGRPLGETRMDAGDEAAGFQPLLSDPPAPPVILAGPWRQRRDLLRAAADHANRGRSACVVSLSPTTLAHWMRFTDAGVWHYSGGQFGRADRGDPRVQFWKNRTRRDRIATKIAQKRNNQSQKWPFG